jgi:transposase InsO family protein
MSNNGRIGTQTRLHFVGYKISGYGRYMKFKHNLTITQSNYIANRRLSAITFYEDYGLKATLEAFNISRSTLFTWRNKYIKSKYSVDSLIPKSTKPINTRRMLVNPLIINFIKDIREKYPRMSKCKIKTLLDEYCKQNDITLISESLIGKVIKRNNMFYFKTGKVYHNPNKRPTVPRKPKKRLSTEFKAKYPGHLIQVDTIVTFDMNIKRYTLTAIDIYSRFTFALTYKQLSSKVALDFYQKLEYVFPGIIENVKTDNGLEFHGLFDDYLTANNITHYFSYPRTPKSNAFIERFNRTIQEEFIYSNLEFIENTDLFNKKLVEYLVFYNTIRPHYSLNNITPMSYIISRNLTQEKSNMCVTRTIY